MEDAVSDGASALEDKQEAAGNTGSKFPAGRYYLSFGKITEDLVYVSMIPESIISLHYLGVTALGGGLGEESASMFTLAIGAYC